ncbi:hypothetical protein [Lutibacter sp.]
MKNSIKVLFLIFFMFSNNLFSQESFPKSWEGNYQGELQIFDVDSVKMKVTMKLTIVKKTDSVYQWKMMYDFKGKEDIRDYELKIIDFKKGHYIIDEKNTIEIAGYYKMQTFTSFFEVMNSYIISTYTKNNEDILFEIIAARTDKPSFTGNSKYKEVGVPEVKSFFINGRQRAMLKKISLTSN